MTHMGDIGQFHGQFGMFYGGPPRELPDDLMRFRLKFLYEELDEYYHACVEGDVAGQLDALVDLVYVALGTAYLHGFPFDEAWRRVHTANMRKEYSPSSVKGVIKPEGWAPPDLSDLVRSESDDAGQKEGG